MKKSNALFVGGIVALLFLGGTFWYLNSVSYDLGGYSGWHMGPGHMGFMGMRWMMLIFWGVVLFGLILLISSISKLNENEEANRSESPDALEILRRRYAGGIIDKAEYDAKLRDLTMPGLDSH